MPKIGSSKAVGSVSYDQSAELINYLTTPNKVEIDYMNSLLPFQLNCSNEFE